MGKRWDDCGKRWGSGERDGVIGGEDVTGKQ